MVKHFLADGREVRSIAGKVIPTKGPTEAVYRIVLEHSRMSQNLEKKDKEEVRE